MQGFNKDDTWFSICIKIIKAIMKNRIIGSPTDQIAVILYGTVQHRAYIIHITPCS